MNVERLKRRKDHIIFLICLFMAALSWLLIKLSDDYSVTYPLKIEYSDLPENKILKTVNDSVLNVSFKSDGYNLLDLYLYRKLRFLKINLSKVKMVKIRDGKYEIFTRNLAKLLSRQLNVNESDISFSVPKLQFQVENLYSKVIPVKAKLNLTFKSQFALYKSIITPSKVRVFAPKNVLDSLKYVYTKLITLNELGKDEKIKVGLLSPGKEIIRIKPNNVNIVLEVRKYTEFSFKVPVNVSKVKPQIRTFPSSVTVYFNMFLEDYKNLSPKDFKVVPDVKNINLGKVNMLNLKVVKHPANVSNIRLDPVSVEFIILN